MALNLSTILKPARLQRYMGLAGSRVVLVLFVAVTAVAILGQTLWAIYQDRALTLAGERENGLVGVRLRTDGT